MSKYQIRVVSKEISIEHTKRIGIICGAHVKLVSNRKCVSMISNEINVIEKNIEIRKRNVHEKYQVKNIGGACYRKQG